MERRKDRDVTILTNDPSFTNWGWAIINLKGEAIACGCIRTAPEHKKLRIRKSDDTGRRAGEIIRHLKMLIEKYNVGFILSEAPHGSQNANAAVMIGVVTGIVYAMSECLRIPLETYSEGDSKKNALGKLSASKDEMIEAMKKVYGNSWRKNLKYYDEAVADALAIHYVASKQSNVIKMMTR